MSCCAGLFKSEEAKSEGDQRQSKLKQKETNNNKDKKQSTKDKNEANVKGVKKDTIKENEDAKRHSKKVHEVKRQSKKDQKEAKRQSKKKSKEAKRQSKNEPRHWFDIDLRNRIHHAVAGNNVTSLQQLMKNENVPVDYCFLPAEKYDEDIPKNHWEYTLFGVAVDAAADQIVDFILDQDYVVNYEEVNPHMSILQYAIDKRESSGVDLKGAYSHIINTLLEVDENPESKYDGLICALDINNFDLAKRMINSPGFEPNFQKEAGDHSHLRAYLSALEMAVASSKADIVDLLLEKGGVLDPSLLVSCCSQGQLDVAISLLKHGMAPDPDSLQEIITTHHQHTEQLEKRRIISLTNMNQKTPDPVESILRALLKTGLNISKCNWLESKLTCGIAIGHNTGLYELLRGEYSKPRKLKLLATVKIRRLLREAGGNTSIFPSVKCLSLADELKDCLVLSNVTPASCSVLVFSKV